MVSVKARVFGVRAFLITLSEPKLSCLLWALFQGTSRGFKAAVTSWQKRVLGQSWPLVGFSGLVLPLNHRDDGQVFISFAFMRRTEAFGLEMYGLHMHKESSSLVLEILELFP